LKGGTVLLIWGFKTEAAFDFWSFEHFLNGVSTAAFADFAFDKTLGRRGFSDEQKRIVSFLLVLILALFWESAEHYVEAGFLPGEIGAKITWWFQGVEHWSNRLIADNLMVMLGWFVYIKKKNLAWAAKAFSAVWMFIHIFIFPHSMYLHTLLGSK
jgi:hypothetical protein